MGEEEVGPHKTAALPRWRQVRFFLLFDEVRSFEYKKKAVSYRL